MEGHIEGGWGFVTAAYTVVWGGIIAYVFSIYFRTRRAKLDADPGNVGSKEGVLRA